MRNITYNGLNLIKQFEGFSPALYICQAGYPTIGFGHVVKSGENFNHRITEQQAEELLQQDVHAAEHAVLRLINVPLTNGQYDALVSFTYNLGSGALQRSTLRRKVNREEHGEVPAEFIRWVYAGGRKSAGLVRRRSTEARVYSHWQ